MIKRNEPSSLSNSTAVAPPPPAESERRLETFDAAWQIIHDTHFDTNFNGVDWRAVRAELRPQAEAARNRKELRAVIEQMLGRLGQSHMALIPREAAIAIHPKRIGLAAQDRSASTPEKNGGAELGSAGSSKLPASGSDDQERDVTSSDAAGHVGFDVRLIERKLIVWRVDPEGPAKEAGVKPGWIIQSIGDRSTQELIEKLPSDLDPRQMPFMAWRLAKTQLLGQPGSSVQIQFLDEKDRLISLVVKRVQEPGEPVKLGFLPKLYAQFGRAHLKTQAGFNAGLIRFNLWMIPVAAPFDKAIDEFRQADGIIIDLRGNLGGLGGMVMGFSGHFLKERLSLGTMRTRGSEMKFFTNPRRVNPSGQKVEPYSGPLAILIDGVSLSAAEIFAGGMQAVGRARVFGETSPGQALPALWDQLPNGDVLYHAVADFVTPTGVRLEKRGVIPDEIVPLSRESLLAGRDPALTAALNWIAQERGKRPQAAIPASANAP